ncbi:MAG: tRNA (N6-isopentenyl adenosine(37)-C2)-methylthiotransferase MiaB [Chloroflexi bacterium]|nr:tRNA (N6-isopentenyl adenosine(37)-C2)-methylthiotransferase MiaB [Chloroflexota bacterium]
MRTKTYHIWTIGCQMNVADSNHVAAHLDRLGYEPVDRPEDADVIVLNTCVVRQSAENKVIGKLGSLKPLKKKQPDKVIALMGCFVGIKPNPALQERFPWVDVFMPPSEPAPLVNLLTQDTLNADARAADQQATQARWDLQDTLTTQSLRHLSLRGEIPVAAYVPVVYGCSFACTYCIIPYRRGKERSRPLEEIVAEVKDLVAQGVREVTLLGQIVDRYGYDWGGQPDLADLLRAIHDIDGLWRIRFLTSHPNFLSDRVLDAIADLPKVMPHIEVPIQAGDDEVLARMRRGYTVADYYQLVEKIRQRVPDAAIHTDIIVGFPGETEEQFLGTYRVLEELRLDKAHLARYSPRPGTVSARFMEDDVPEEEKRRRHRLLEELQERIQREKNQALVGERVTVLVEGQRKGKWEGRTPQNKIVFIEHPENLRSRLVEVEIVWAGPYSLQGRYVRDVRPAHEG